MAGLHTSGPVCQTMQSGDYDRRDALPVGTVLREYTLEGMLGQGGFGIVYKSRHNELDLPVAIKEYLPIELAVREGSTVRPRRATDSQEFESGLRRFRDEARALVQLRSHEHIVSCRDFFRGNGTAYLVMDYEAGPSLAEVLAKREAEGRPFDESDLLAVMVPLLEGLARVHEAGLLHRDIKPSNILIRQRDEQPVLIDFGAAKQVVAKHSKSLAPYTEGYAAPEQVADAGALGPWTDVYGAGAVMWRMVAGGQPPWAPPNPVRAESRALARIRGADDTLPSACELGMDQFSASTLEAIDKCLRLHEQERFQGCQELLGVLQETELDARMPTTQATADNPAKRIDSASSDLDQGANLPPNRAVRAKRGVRWIALVSMAAGLVLGFGLARWSLDLNGETAGGPGIRLFYPELSPGERFRDCEYCPEMVALPKGSFVMGSPAAEEGRGQFERPMHRVKFAYSLAVSVYEVTFQEWDACVDFGNCRGYLPDDEQWGRGRRPVVNLSWDDAQEYVSWLSAETGREYRLLSEAEWEYAARAGTRTPYYFGDEVSPRLANFGSVIGKTVAGGSYPANAFGLHDVHGNVWEWVADCWNYSYGGAPTDGSTWSRGNCRSRILRGGSWGSEFEYVRSASRVAHSPDTRSSYIGLRIGLNQTNSRPR